MSRKILLVNGLIVLMLSLNSCTERISEDDLVCEQNDVCIAGYLCDPLGVCVKAEPVSIKNINLPNAVVGEEGYSQPMQAQAGISPFSWTLIIETGAEQLDWLEIVPSTGELRAKAGEAPAETAQDLSLLVKVTDSSNHGQGQTAELPLKLTIVECRADVACYLPEAGVCQQGVYKCESGVLATVCTLSGPSTDAGHCGSDCSACPEGTANRCESGECRCGSLPPCSGGLACCGSGCYDLNTEINHCGDCDTDCREQTIHAIGVTCTTGQCDFTACEAGHFSCDSSKQNGCETVSDLDNCSNCEDDCANSTAYPHTENPLCVASECEFDCAQGYGDCTADAGCETLLGTDSHCADCDDTCDKDAAPACVVVNDQTRCGCENQADCPADRLCCATQTCLIHSTANCATCDDVCSPQNGGNLCLGDLGSGWHCGCEANTDCAISQLCCNGTCQTRSDSACETCDIACSLGAGGLSCVGNDNTGYRCGCAADADCAADKLCCDETCIDHEPNNCTACADVCTVSAGGTQCDGNVTDGWACGCTIADDHCDSNQLCCDDLCLTPNDTNCTACATPCTKETGGLVCQGNTNDGYQCGCDTLADCSADKLCCDESCIVHTENNCTACADICTVAEGGTACIDGGANNWHCGCDSEADCDPGQLCCNNQCQTPTDASCELCGIACTAGLGSGTVCKQHVDDSWHCDCDNDGNCQDDHLCCNAQCITRISDNCTACDHTCTIGDGGLTCAKDPTNGWGCTCGSHDECKGDYTSFSEAFCDTTGDKQCFCNITPEVTCDATIDSMCCYVSGAHPCTDLRTDKANCGICGRACTGTNTCGDNGFDGVCGCADGGTCPNVGTEKWFCSSNLCVCTDLYGDAAPEPCPPGQYCCNLEGCCTKSCDTAGVTDCSDDCLSNGDIWCSWGCCDACNDESECGQYAP